MTSAIKVVLAGAFDIPRAAAMADFKAGFNRIGNSTPVGSRRWTTHV
jgi:hypothetical protein